MKTEIGQINLALPQGFEQRAQRIGRLVGAELANRQGLPQGRIEALSVGPVRVDAKHSDLAIAKAVASAIANALGAHFPPGSFIYRG